MTAFIVSSVGYSLMLAAGGMCWTAAQGWRKVALIAGTLVVGIIGATCIRLGATAASAPVNITIIAPPQSCPPPGRDV